jgi:tocopherol O-methyltransferase
MISGPTVSKHEIRSHYDLATVFYRLLWGRHIHHGLWEAQEPARVAVQRLTDTLAREAGISGDARVLDVGCGMGGSSIHLAREIGCQVTGVTLSPFQRWWATTAAGWHRVTAKTQFLCADAEHVSFEDASFDVVWSVECTEHLFDKPAFFKKAAGWLRPGGRLAICAWLAGDHPLHESARQQVYDVCEGFLCPSLGTRHDYAEWITSAGLVLESDFDWTPRVTRTWELCEDRVRRSGVRWLARLVDRNTVVFLDRFRTILKAYQTGAMKYGCFIARAPV